ncbi:nitroreductase family protein [Butyrivibrio fibrisolvens]|uniref:Nitroreductase n=1 Tax=Butyrivibrio fibrisolvens TaxID=831 RepID=A0A1H9KNA5_BUTFI|nr:nitroreductase family protein [Butyrivibrio fibrisolvens]SER00397.1 Nitroreductase [Butyrivibrio fibrisolvens]
MGSVFEVIKERSSTRGYTEDKLSEVELNTVLEAGLHAPTGMNKQEIHFTVVSGDNEILAQIEAEKNRLRNLDKVEHNFYYEAPTVILLSAESGFKWSHVDAGIAVENMALAATELGLGNLIIGCIYDALNGEKKDYFAKKLSLPEGYEFEIALAVGHKAVTKEPHTFDKDKQVTIL